MALHNQPILVVGSDARTHALVRKLREEGDREVFCVPSNAGIIADSHVGAVEVKSQTDTRTDLISFANAVNALTIVNPELPLVSGIFDDFAAAGVPHVGPSRDGARIEGDKQWCCNLLAEAGVPIPRFREFNDANAAVRFLGKASYPLVVKAKGLCAGKGVRICATVEEAVRAVEDFMIKKIFNDAGAEIVIQEFLVGRELSMFAFVDKDGYALYTLFSQDHKTLGKGNTGPMTGGMGAYAPVPFATEELRQICIKRIFEPTLRALASRGIHYQGILYAGLMITDAGPYVLEFNCRFGDPETEVVLAMLKKPMLGDILERIVYGGLDRLGELEWHEGAACFVVKAAVGYPDQPKVGDVISGLDHRGQLVAPPDHDGEIYVLHAGTIHEDGVWKTSGGRVLGVCCRAASHELAVEGAYKGAARINWRGAYQRPDIGAYAYN